MRLLYVADNGFSFHEGKYYYSRPNAVNSAQYEKYFDSICFIARQSDFKESMLPIDNNRKVALVGRYDMKGLKRAMLSIKDEYDAVLVRNGLLGCFAAKYAKELGKLLISYCGSDPFEFQFSQGTLKGRVIAYYWRQLEKRKMQLGDYAHYCTDVLRKRYPCRGAYLICSNVSIKVDKDILLRRENRIKQPHNHYVIGLMGQYRDNDQKGISTVIKALNVLKGDYRFEIVGDGNAQRYYPALKQYGLEDKVSFLGYMSDKNKINSWLDNLDFYVQPSLSEGLPRATIEAMSRGCPVVASNVCGMVDLLSEEYLIKPKDHNSLADKVKKMSDVQEMLLAARRNFEKASEYAEDIRDKKLDAFFTAITKGKGYEG